MSLSLLMSIPFCPFKKSKVQRYYNRFSPKRTGAAAFLNSPKLCGHHKKRVPSRKISGGGTVRVDIPKLCGQQKKQVSNRKRKI
jgi:hypothetical protein